MDITVAKFGGSSLATDEQIHAIADRVAGEHRRGRRLVVVVSARGDTTDRLVAEAQSAARTVRSRAAGAAAARETDQLLATGEIASAALLALALQARGVEALSLTGPRAGLRAIGTPGAGVVTDIDTEPLLDALGRGAVAVVAGFQAETECGDVITLGRGGSDTSAVALAAALGAVTCEIYTDVDGVSDADPRLVHDAALLPAIPAGVMAEMAFAGARVLHPRAVELAAATGVDIVVSHAHRGGPGSTIVGRNEMELETRAGVHAVTHEEGLAQLRVRGDGRGTLAGTQVLDALAEFRICVDSLIWSPPTDDLDVRICVRGDTVDDVRAALEPLLTAGGMLTVRRAVGKVSLVGAGLLSRPTLAVRALAELAARDISAACMSATQARLSFVVPGDRVHDAVRVLHTCFCPVPRGAGTTTELASA